MVPAKDAEDTIGRTFSSIEPHLQAGGHCILVDDGSTDQTSHLMQGFADKWENTRYLRRDVSQGAGSARNLALDNIKTALFGTIDADDWVHRDYYQSQINLMNKYDDVEFVRTNFIKCVGADRELKSAHFDVFNRPFDPQLAINPVNKATLVDHAQMWSGIYSMDFLNAHNIRFDNLFTAEDRIINWKTQVLGKRMIMASENRFFYRRGNNQSLTEIGDIRQLDILKALENVLEFLIAEDKKEFLPKVSRQCFAMICFHLNRSDRLEKDVHALLIKRSNWLLNILPDDLLDTSLKQLDEKRRNTIKGLL